MWSLSRTKRSLAAVVAAGALLLLPTTSAAEPGPWPGLPLLDNTPPPNFPDSGSDRNVAAWLNAPYTGLAGSSAAQQWVRIPLGTLASNILVFNCRPAQCNFPTSPNLATYAGYDLVAFLVSPDSSDAPYGDSQVATVRTVAFGAIPVEVDLQFAQLRDENGLPQPLRGNFSDELLLDAASPSGQTTVFGVGTLTGSVVIRVVDMRIDGVNVGLTSDCSTEPTSLELFSEEASTPTGNLDVIAAGFDPKKNVWGTQGGGFSGVVDIPAFRSCSTTAGDDLAPVLTAALSGPGNPVSVQYGAALCFAEILPGGFAAPTPPGADTPEEAGCIQYQMFPDTNPDIWAVPLPWDIPDYAPGEAAP